MNSRRVVVTGLGLLTPVGNCVKSSWEAIREGKSGIAPIEHFDVESFGTRFGGSLKDFDCSKYIEPKDSRRMDIFMQYGIAAGVQAFDDSGLTTDKYNPERCGVTVLSLIHI